MTWRTSSGALMLEPTGAQNLLSANRVTFCAFVLAASRSRACDV